MVKDGGSAGSVGASPASPRADTDGGEPLVGQAEAVLAPIDARDRWGRAARAAVTATFPLTSPMGDALVHLGKARATAPSATWLRVDDDLRARLPGGELPALGQLLLRTLLATELAPEEHEGIKERQRAAYDVLRALERERQARAEGTLAYLRRPDDGPVTAWARSVNPRLERLPEAVGPGALLDAANADLLRGAVWTVALRPSEVDATADLLAAVAVHGVEVNRGLEPGTEVLQAAKVVNAAITMLGTLPGSAARPRLEHLQATITNGHHRTRITKALAALS